MDGIQAALTIDGSGPDTMNVDDTGSTIAKPGALTSTTLTGLDMGPEGITYGGIADLFVSLGSGGNTFLIASTHQGHTTVNSGLGTNTINVQTINGSTLINGQGTNDTINVSSVAPDTGGIVDLIGAVLSVDGGNGVNVVNVDDTGSTVPKTARFGKRTDRARDDRRIVLPEPDGPERLAGIRLEHLPGGPDRRLDQHGDQHRHRPR